MDLPNNFSLYQNSFLAALDRELNNIDLLKQLPNLPRIEQMRKIIKKLEEYHKFRGSKERKQNLKGYKKAGVSKNYFLYERQKLIKYLSNFSPLALECYLDDNEYFMDIDIINAFVIVPIVYPILKTVTSLQNDSRSLTKGIVKQAVKVAKDRQA